MHPLRIDRQCVGHALLFLFSELYSGGGNAWDAFRRLNNNVGAQRTTVHYLAAEHGKKNAMTWQRRSGWRQPNVWHFVKQDWWSNCHWRIEQAQETGLFKIEIDPISATSCRYAPL